MYAHLRSPWCDGAYRPGDPVALLAELDLHAGQWHALLDMERGGMLVHHPDLLLSGGRWAGAGARWLGRAQEGHGACCCSWLSGCRGPRAWGVLLLSAGPRRRLRLHGSSRPRVRPAKP